MMSFTQKTLAGGAVLASAVWLLYTHSSIRIRHNI